MPALDKGFGKTVEGAMATAGSKGGASLQAGMLGGLADAAGKIVAALGLFEIAKKFAEVTKMAVDAYADYEQLVGGVETLYGDAADDLIANAQRAYQTAGMSANDYMEMTTSFAASLVNSLGGDTEEAARMADMAIRDMSDNANKMGTDMAAIQNAYQGFAKQNYTMLDNLKLGYGGTKTEMERLLKDAEALTGIHYDIGNLSDVYEAIHVIQTELGITGTTAKEASTTILGAFNMVKASWQNVLVAMADPNADLSAVFGDMVSSITTLLKNAIPIVGEIATQLIIQLPDAVIELAPVLLEAVGQMLLSVGERLEQWMEEVMLTFANWFLECLDGIGQWFSDLGSAISSGIDSVVEWFATLPDRVLSLLYDLASQAYEAGKAIVVAFGQGILANFSAALDPMASLAEAASGYLPHSPAKVGAFSGKGYPLYSGMAIADSLGEGFTKRIGSVTRQIAAGMDSLASAVNGGVTNNTNISMSVTADSTTTLDNLVAQARRARALNGGF